eukprot:3474142-Pyramimonas_sp.AAC.1
MLTTTFVFELLQSDDDVFWRSVRLRENTAVDQRAMYRTPFQRICEIVTYKKKVEQSTGPITNKALAALYKNRGGVADEENLTETYIDGAIT